VPFNNPEQQPSAPKPEDDPGWKELQAELMGHPATEEGLAAARREMLERQTEIGGHEMMLRRFDLMKKIFEAGDLVTSAPSGFPDREVLNILLIATSSLSSPLLAENRARQLKKVLAELQQVHATLDGELSSVEHAN
jgi:hypothetical protein